MHRVVTEFVEAEHALEFGNEIPQFLSKFRISLGSLDKAQQFYLNSQRKLPTHNQASYRNYVNIRRFAQNAHKWQCDIVPAGMH